jgi:acyl carrier protein
MNRSEILTVIREELAVAAPDVPADAATDAHFGLDLEVDSLAVLEFVARLEYRYGIAVPDDAWPGLSSMDAVADFLESTLVAAS